MVTEGQSINFSDRPFAGTDNLARLLAEVIPTPDRKIWKMTNFCAPRPTR